MESVYEKAYDELKKEFEQYKLESIKWGILDFTTLQVDGQEISDENAQSALEQMIQDHDCNYGISWSTVTDYFWRYSDKVPEGEERWRKDLENVETC